MTATAKSGQPLRATKDMENNGRILEYWMKLNTSSTTVVFLFFGFCFFLSISSVTDEDENTNSNSETRAALVEAYAV